MTTPATTGSTSTTTSTAAPATTTTSAATAPAPIAPATPPAATSNSLQWMAGLGTGVIHSDIPDNCLTDPAAFYLQALAGGSIPLTNNSPFRLFGELGVRAEFQFTNTAGKALTSDCKGVLDEGNQTSGSGTAPVFPSDTNGDGVIDENDTPTTTTTSVDSGLGSDATIGGEIDVGPTSKIGVEVRPSSKGPVAFVGAAYFSLDHLWATTPGQTFGNWDQYGAESPSSLGHTDFMVNADAGIDIGNQVDLTATVGLGNRTADAMSPDGVNTTTPTNRFVTSGGLNLTFHDKVKASTKPTPTTPISDTEKSAIADKIGIIPTNIATKTKMSPDGLSLWLDVTGKGIKNSDGEDLTSLVLKKSGDTWTVSTLKDDGGDKFATDNQTAVQLLGTTTSPTTFATSDLKDYLVLATTGYSNLLASVPAGGTVPKYQIVKVKEYWVFLPKKIAATEGADTTIATILAPNPLTHTSDNLELLNNDEAKVVTLPLKAGLNPYQLTKDQLATDLTSTPATLTSGQNVVKVKVAGKDAGQVQLNVTKAGASLNDADVASLRTALGHGVSATADQKVLSADGSQPAKTNDGSFRLKLDAIDPALKDSSGVVVLTDVIFKANGAKWELFKADGVTKIQLDTGPTAASPASFDSINDIVKWIMAGANTKAIAALIPRAQSITMNGKTSYILPITVTFARNADTLANPTSLNATLQSVAAWKDPAGNFVVADGSTITVYGFAGRDKTLAGDTANLAHANARGTNLVTVINSNATRGIKGVTPGFGITPAGTFEAAYYAQSSTPGAVLIIGDAKLSDFPALVVKQMTNFGTTVFSGKPKPHGH